MKINPQIRKYEQKGDSPMTTPRRSLYQRLPEIYHIRDAEQLPPGQLQAYLDVIDAVQTAIRDNIETLYHDFFIETGDDWVIPYIADLLGTSHLSGDQLDAAGRCRPDHSSSPPKRHFGIH